MMKSFIHNKSEQKAVALERIKSLFEQAENNFKLDSKLSDRYVVLARKIAMRYRVRIPSPEKRKFCRHCSSFLMPSKNCRIRTKEGMLIIYCMNCKKFNKFVYRK